MSEAGYYSVIPATVRYDPDLTANAKLLYGEITALANSGGFCWAANAYFAELYNVSIKTVSRWISELSKKGYIKIEVVRNSRNEVLSRNIFIQDTPSPQNCGEGMDKIVDTSPQKTSDPPPKNAEENNTRLTIKSQPPKRKKLIFIVRQKRGWQKERQMAL